MNYHLRSLPTALCIAFAIFTPCRLAIAQLDDEVNEAVLRIDKDLSSPFARVGLEKIVLDLYDARVKLAPHRVETTPDWQTGFMKSFSVFQKRLHERRFERITYGLNRNVIEGMQAHLRYNEHANSSFLRSAREQFPQLRNVPISALQRSQTYFSLILALEGMDEWTQAARASYIFPFCTRSY